MLRRTHSASKNKKDTPPADASAAENQASPVSLISPASDDSGEAGLSRSASSGSRIGSRLFKKVVSPPVQHAPQTHLHEHTSAETAATPTPPTAAAPKT